MSQYAPASPVRRPCTLAGWDGSLGGARALQCMLAAQVQLSDGFRSGIRTVGGFSAASFDGGRTVHAAGVVLDAQTLQPLYQRRCVHTTQVPYVRELLGFRVLPALLDVFDALPMVPDVSLVDGHGIAHPRRFGLASHFGVATGLVTIGIGRAPLSGTCAEPGTTPGDSSRLFDGDQQIGWAVRTRPRAGAVFVSPGHRITLSSSLEFSLRFQGAHRLPEPIHLAGGLAAERPLEGPTPGARVVRAGQSPARRHHPLT